MESQRVKILLVEDDPDDVWVMRNLLADRWDGPFDLVHVELLSAALEQVAAGGVDVVLLDLTLPDSRGLESFLMMHARAGDVPIVVLTGLDDETAAVKAVQTGAQDYLVKGQVDDNLLVRSIRYAIERTKRHDAERALRATSEEFRAAQQIQQRLFPARPPEVEGFDIGGAVYPARATAGDYFDYIPLGGGHWGIVVADVSGHGMASALVMAEVRACLRTLALTHPEPDEILTRANRLLLTDTDEFQFVTLCMARLDPLARSLVYASAGQRGYLFDASGDVLVLDSTSIPLGIEELVTVPLAPAVTLQPGAMVVFFTDGVVEAESRRHARFGTQRALDLIRDHRHQPARKIIETLYAAIVQFCGQPQHDDITAVVVKVLPDHVAG